jgi:hypothetical protein
MWNDMENTEDNFLPHLSYHFTFQFTFIFFFPYHFTIFFCIFHIFSLFNLELKCEMIDKCGRQVWNSMENREEKEIEMWNDY